MKELKGYIIAGLLVMVFSYPFYAFTLPTVEKCSLCRQSISYPVNTTVYLSLCAGAMIVAFGAGKVFKNRLMHLIFIFFLSIIVVFLGTRLLYINALQSDGEYYALFLLSLTLALCVVIYGLEHLGRYFMRYITKTFS
jgi:hypothetical protein